MRIHFTRYLQLLFAAMSLWAAAAVPAWAQEGPAATGIPSLDPAPVKADWWSQRHEQKLNQIAEDNNIDLVMLGDSITHGWENGGKAVFQEFFGKYKTLNIGYSGDRTEHVLWRLNHGEVEGISPKVLVMMIGTNNTGHYKAPAEQTALGISLILADLKRRLPETQILMLGVFPRDAGPDGELRQINEKINAIISRLGDGDDVHYLNINESFLDDEGGLPKDVMPDLLHPNEKGYRIWAEAIAPTVEKLMAAEDDDEGAEGFEPIFDGKSLKGWDGDEAFWSVQDGALTGKTTEDNPLKSNTFIIWDGKVKNFELKLKFRLTAGNSGIQYRSQNLGDHVVGGYQADMDFAKQWVGILYDERGRGILATRMQNVLLKADGSKDVSPLDGSEENFLKAYQPEQWNTYHVIADGNKLTHRVNGITTIEVEDQQEDGESEGILALQLHTGPPMVVQYKDIELKDLDK